MVQTYPGDWAMTEAKRAKHAAKRKVMLAEIAQIEPHIRKAAADDWLLLNVTQMESYGSMTYHWMFNDAATGARILNYWPGNGKWWCPEDNTRGTVKYPWEALEVARNKAPALLIGNREQNEVAEAA